MKAYLDNSATTRPTQGVIRAMTACMEEGWHNPSSVYGPAVAAFRQVRACREAILEKLGASGETLIFTSGGTEADYEALHKALNDGASLVSCMQVNNETGALLDVQRLKNAVADRALIHVDGVQGFLRVPFHFADVDMYTISAHKLHGPKGVGALAVKKGVRLNPQHIGGGQEEDLRSGTENTPGIAGFFEAVREMDASGLMEKKLHMVKAFIDAVPEAAINGPAPEKGAPHILNISFPGVRGETMLHALEAEGVYASTGSACSSKKRKVSSVLTAMGIPVDRAESALRFSLSPHTTLEEIDYAAEVLRRVWPQLRRFQRR